MNPDFTKRPDGFTESTKMKARILLAALFLLLAAGVVRSAWLCDDAFITFRCVENLCTGNGAVWNTGERVQAFTHPLWFLLLALLRAVTGECEHTTLALGIVLALASALWAARLTGSALGGAATLLLLLGSRYWMDFATSGLETPLVFLLLMALIAARRSPTPHRRLLGVALVTGLLGTTRLDLLLLCAPVLVSAAHGLRVRPAIGLTALGLSPLVAWTCFSIVYYGSPFPITAYAKAMAHGLPMGELFGRGLHYLARNALADPMTMLVVATGIVLGMTRKPTRALALGQLLYLAYVVRVGGDYMLGRFLLPCFVLSAPICGNAIAALTPMRATIVMVASAALAFVPDVPKVLLPARIWSNWTIPEDGLVDEMAFYHVGHGLFSPYRLQLEPGETSRALRQNGQSQRLVTVGGGIGSVGYRAGDLVHIVDPWLLDPLLMHLPVADRSDWRIGHYYRRIPEGYLESLASNENRLLDPRLARYYDALKPVLRDPIWSAPRWRALWQLASGQFTADLAAYVDDAYYAPPRLHVPLDELRGAPPPTPAGVFPNWSDVPAARGIYAGGLDVATRPDPAVRELVLHLTGGHLACSYRVSFRRAGTTVGTATITTATALPDTLHPCRTAVPAGAEAFDAVWIDAQRRSAADHAIPTVLGGVELLH